MSLRCLTLVAVCVVFISTVSGEDVKKAVGDEVSFRPDKVSSITIITWKHRNSDGMVVKVIEWDVEDGFSIPNQRFQGITTLDEKTGQITITNLKVEHSGLYTIDINSKEQQQRFSLTVMGGDVKKAVGETVSFRPDKLESPITSITWKHRNSDGMVVKVIEWDVDDGVSIPNQRFQGITTLDEKTGQITINNLKVEHSGIYSIDINSREQEQRFTLTVMGEEVKKVVGVVGGTVSFHPTSTNPPITSITWKHRNSGIVVKVIEWDDEGVSIPNTRFQGITTLDEKTGEITITNLTVEHSGTYTIDINSKEQEQRFTLTVMGGDVKKAVGETVSFRPPKLESPITSITWKQRNSVIAVKVIEWDVDDGVIIPNPRFQDITTLDEKTGQITITNLKVEHSGLYTIDINSREQEQRFTLTVTGGDVKKAVGETVSFRPDKLESPITSITWKQRNSGMAVKAIEWDVDDGVIIPNPRFQGITTLDEKTGQITITNLKVEHNGIYSIDINSREQEQRFSLTVMERVPKPVITIEKGSNPDVVYLRCGYSETIIWKNATGDTLKGTKNHTPGESITVTNTKNPDNFYTCTLKNAVSEEISNRVYEREIFN